MISDGIDFYYAFEPYARKLVDFLMGAAPCRFDTSKRLISHDIHSNTYNYKYTFSVEIAPICKVKTKISLPFYVFVAWLYV